MSDTVLMLDNICKIYIQANTKLVVLENLNLHLKQGEIISIIGESGSGKSTLLHIAGLLDSFDSGTMNLVGKMINNSNKDTLRAEHIGFIYQHHHLLSNFTAWENIAMPLIIKGINIIQAKEQAMCILRSFNLENKANNLIGELSGGQQQRVSIARSLINKPNLILADEPTGNLDPKTAEEVFELLMDTVTTQNITMVIVTHNHNLARKTHYTYLLNAGKLSSFI